MTDKSSTVDFDWKNLPFGYVKTDYNVQCHYKNGQWGRLVTTSSDKIDLHIATSSLHYGQQAFEGMKAFRGKNDEIRLFRWRENAKRLQSSARGILMPEVSEELFYKALTTVIKANSRFIPPYKSGASLYIRPLLIGYGAQVGVGPSDEYLFTIFVTPVGPYFKTGFKPISVMLTREFDRAAPFGTGHIKIGGNYAASLRSLKKAKELGCNTALYLDAKEKKYIDECGPANFFAIKNDTYITPDSETILPSITNKSLKVLAKDHGLAIEERKVPVEELATFSEAGACGTAAVITPIGKVLDDNGILVCTYGDSETPGRVSTMLYHNFLAIQHGDAEDKHGWVDIIN